MGKLDQRKIATCCYCGNRSVLDLTARGGIECHRRRIGHI
jgi:hypothetical protein